MIRLIFQVDKKVLARMILLRTIKNQSKDMVKIKNELWEILSYHCCLKKGCAGL